MEPIVWTLAILLMITGLAGVILPIIPGPILIFIAALGHKIFIPHGISWWTVGLIGLGVVICMLVDWLCVAAGIKIVGASKWAFMGAGIGFLVGMAFAPLGIIIGPVLGALLAEWLIARRNLIDAGKAGLTTGAGLLIATILRTVVTLAMIASFFIDYYFF